MNTLGFLWQIGFTNPYRTPPCGLPKILAEIFVPYTGSPKEPPEIEMYPRPPGYSTFITPITKPIKPYSAEKRAQIRRQRLERRMQKSYPLFAEQFSKSAIMANPSYYLDGLSPEDDAYNRTMAEYQERLDYLQANAGRLLEYVRPETPDSARLASSDIASSQPAIGDDDRLSLDPTMGAGEHRQNQRGERS